MLIVVRERKLTSSWAKISGFVSSNDCPYPDEHWILPILCSSTFAMRIACVAIASSVDGVCRWCPGTVWTGRTARFFLFQWNESVYHPLFHRFFQMHKEHNVVELKPYHDKCKTSPKTENYVNSHWIHAMRIVRVVSVVLRQPNSTSKIIYFFTVVCV